MKHILITAAAFASFATFSATASAQTPTQCAKGEGRQIQYDFNVLDDGSKTLKYRLRMFSDCVAGKSASTTFRGVPTELGEYERVRTAVRGVENLIEAGLTDPAAIKQLIDLVAPVLKADDERKAAAEAEAAKAAAKQPTAKTASPTTDSFSKLFGADSKGK